MKKAILAIIVCILLGVMGYSAYRILSLQAEYREGDQTYEELRQYEAPETDKSVRIQSHIPESDGSGSTIPWDITLPEVDFDELRAINPDVIGWITCEGTRIDYPVVRGETNEKYLHHMFDGRYNYAGSIFMETANTPDFSDFNTILYGHHMRNGSMFHDLVLYKEDGFYEEHPYLLLLTPEKNYVLEVFGGFVSSLRENSWQIDFADDAERLAWIAGLKEKSEFETPVDVTTADRIVTLSTCSYEFSNARYVVYGILIEIPEE